MSAGAALFAGLTASGSLSTAAHSHTGKWVPAAGRGLVPAHVGLSIGCLNVLIAGPGSPQSNDSAESQMAVTLSFVT